MVLAAVFGKHCILTNVVSLLSFVLCLQNEVKQNNLLITYFDLLAMLSKKYILSV